ncbi:MAG: methylmalonyl-CoA epimerase [Bacillota bacterium]|jgi:methylmalonyl-CoA epimerase|nr:MAG: methylmalonyl-CoA epimerase [Bacillota bacterium]
MSSLQLDHIGIAVRSIDAVLPLWRDALHATLGDRETIASELVEVQFLSTGDTTTELVEPTCDESPVHRFIEKRGEGLHHVAYRVENLAETMGRLTAAGSVLIYPQPRQGSHETMINFIHPSSTGGILIELVEYPQQGSGQSAEEEIDS